MVRKGTGGASSEAALARIAPPPLSAEACVSVPPRPLTPAPDALHDQPFLKSRLIIVPAHVTATKPLRLHLMVTSDGAPVEFFLLPGADNDTGALHWYQFDLPTGAKIIGDKAFNVYSIEDDLASIDLDLCPLRKKNSKRAVPPWETFLRATYRTYVETAGSMLMQRFPKTIHAVTAVGFELKIVLFLLAYSLDCL